MGLGKVPGMLTTVTFVATCLLATMDTHLFVYPSLSRYLFLELGIISLSFVTLFGLMMTKDGGVVFTKTEVFVLLWVLYVVIYGNFVQPGEHYRMYYLGVSLLLVPVLAGLLRHQLISCNSIETGMMLAAGIHLLYIVGQWTGMMESGNKYFHITGCNENPTVSALLLVGCLPMLLSRLRRTEGRMLFSCLLVITIAGIILLRCRTAYVGMAVEVAVILTIHYRDRLRLFARHWFYTSIAVLAVIAITAAIGNKLYEMKKDSADGRLLIWKLSAAMVAERPMGYGYGLFEKNYNLRQADYFANSESTATEKKNADFVMMPYNDYLEQTIEGGIIGMLFLLVFYIITVRTAIRQRQWEAIAVLSAFAVMSLFNFVYSSIAPWLLVLCYAAIVASTDDSRLVCKRMPRHAPILLLLPAAATLWGVLCITNAQIELKYLDETGKDGHHIDDGRYAAIEKNIGTSEAFWTSRARNSMKAGRYADALESIHQARLYSSSPVLFVAAYRCLVKVGQDDAAMSQLDTLSHMIPQKFNKEQFQMIENRHE